ncbi:LOW QUALITY PROTEIN: PC-esterase domain-containing protein 1A-like [Anableps anableps]
MRSLVTKSQAGQLLHNKFLVILGGSVQRSMYKDLVVLLQRDQHLTLSQLKSKMSPMTYSVEKQPEIKPSTYGLQSFSDYKENLNKFFSEIKTIVCHSCLIVWVLTMPVGRKIKGGFLVPEVSHLGPTCYDIIETNFYSTKLADFNGLDVLDLHFYFRHSLHHRMPDGIHWDALAHRRISSLLLKHVADAWGIKLYDIPQQGLQTLPPARLLQSQQYQPQIRAECSHMGIQFCTDLSLTKHLLTPVVPQ